jgi:Na+-translocating ferredoxin:NAD+ oxidoreductase RnfC subunit
MYNLWRALNNKPVTHKYVTIAGEVKNPRTFYAPIGSYIYGLIKRCGGETVEDPAYLIGGPMMGYLGSENDVVTKTTNAVIVLPKDHPVVLRKQVRVEVDVKRAMAACSQCHYCTDMCPRHMLGHPIDPAEVMRVISNSDSHSVKPYCDASYCSSCGVCEAYACHQGLSPRAVIQEIKKEMREKGFRPPEIKEAPVPVKNFELRRTPLKRLRIRLGLEKYNHLAPIYLDPMNAKEVVINLTQHIGAPTIPVVKVGDKVKENDLIASAAEGKLSVNIHASIDGEVTEVTNKYIKIRS